MIVSMLQLDRLHIGTKDVECIYGSSELRIFVISDLNDKGGIVQQVDPFHLNIFFKSNFYL